MDATHRADLTKVGAGAPGLPVPPQRMVGGVLPHVLLEATIRWVGRNMAEEGARARLVEGMEAEARAMREALEGPNATPLERLLVERVVVCYSLLAAIEGSENAHPANNREAWQKVVDRLQRRYLEACKALATVQRMRLPSSPVFVGGQHVHLESGA